MEPQGRIMDLTDLIRARTGIILSNIVKNMLKEKNQIFFLKRKKFKNNFNMYEVLVYVTNGVANFIWKGKCSESIS
jgi:hypothetical protein